MDKPRILIIENSVAVTGAFKAILNSAKELQQEFDFLFIIPQHAQTKDDVLKAGFTVEQFRMIEINKRFLSLAFYLPQLFINAIKLKCTVKRLNIDLVHVNDLYNLIPATASCLGMRKPYISHVRFLPNRFPKILFSTWMKIQLKFAQKVIAVSETLKHSLPKHDKIIIIYDGFPSGKKVSNQKDAEQTSTFLYLSNFIKGKGQDYAIEAFSRIHAQIPGWRLRFVGGDMGLAKNKLYQQELHDRAVKAGIEEKIEWAGFTDDVEKEYRSAGIAINFSESESFSMTCAEALYYGIPQIASDSGGPAEIIDHNQTGLLVVNQNVEQMSNAMLKLVSDPELRARMKENATEAAQRKFSPEKTSTRLKELYRLSLLK